MSTLMRLKNYSKKNENIVQAELDANTAVSNLIANINILTARKDPLIRAIKSPKLLIRGLTELQTMIEMVDIKHSIVNQIKFLITNHARKQTQISSESNSKQTSTSIYNSNFEGHMLHSVISGNPGTGKTTVGMILAKIWMALGFVKKSSAPSESKEKSSPVLIGTNVVNILNESYRKKIQVLEENQRNEYRRLDRIRELLNRYQTISSDIRRQAIRLRPNSTSVQNADPDTEWDALLKNIREMRFGFDEIIREANVKESTKDTSITPLPVQKEDEDPYENSDPKFIIAGREDFIAEYMGQTAPKTKAVLESARGGVLFIDEAYSLCSMDGGSKDKYGEECLTTINEFMSLYPDELIIIFAGYRDKLMQSIFKAQPGLLRRCVHFFEIEDYTPSGMAKIFARQLSRNSWVLDPQVQVEKFLIENKELIRDGGGGTEKLAFFVKIAYGNSKFEETVKAENEVVHDSMITESIIKNALNLMRKSSIDKLSDDNPPHGMYL